MRWCNVLIVGLSLAQLLSFTDHAHAQLILDDFHDDVHISLPEGQDQYIPTMNVGPFGAERLTSVFAHIANPVGLVDINSLHPSQATLIIESVNHIGGNLQPRIFQEFRYEFPASVDLTNNGEFNAFFIDFEFSRGPVPPQWMRLVVHQDIGGIRSFWVQWMPLRQERLEPFTAVLPFQGFVARGGGPVAPPFTSVPDFFMDFASLGDETAEWEIRLDSIWLGSLPEGDYNGNGLVEQADLDLVLSYWGQLRPPAEWLGDFPNLPIGQAELDGVLRNWGTSVSLPDAATNPAGIPEPSTWLLAVLIGFAAGAKRVISHRRAIRRKL